MKKQLALALTAGVAATGAVVASAATLGGVNAKNLGADTAVIASCQTQGQIAIDYTTAYDTNGTSGQYLVKSIKLSNVNAACNGQTIAITLAGDGNATTGTNGETLAQIWSSTPDKLSLDASGNATVSVPEGTAVLAKSVEHIAIVISGGTGTGA